MNADINTARDVEETLLEALSRNWGWIALRGVAAIVFGLLTLFLPIVSLAALVLLFGCYALVDGILHIIAVFRKRGPGQPWWALLLGGIVSLAAGLVTLFFPGLTAIALVYVIAAWALVTGVFAIVAAIRLRKVITGEGWLVLSGVLSVAFGVVLALFPGPGALAVVLWIGAYSLVFGALIVGLAFRLRRLGAHKRSPHSVEPRVAPAP